MTSRRQLFTGLIGAGAGLMLARTAAAQQATTYTYDVHGRLVGVSRTGGGPTSYAYDAANNRTSRGGSAPPPPPPPPPLSANLSPTTWYGSPSYPDPPVYVTASGGVAPYSYQWRRVSGSNRVYVLANGASASFGGNPEEFYGFTAQFVCKVTDALGTQVDTNSVSATFGPD